MTTEQEDHALARAHTHDLLKNPSEHFLGIFGQFQVNFGGNFEPFLNDVELPPRAKSRLWWSTSSARSSPRRRGRAPCLASRCTTRPPSSSASSAISGARLANEFSSISETVSNPVCDSMPVSRYLGTLRLRLRLPVDLGHAEQHAPHGARLEVDQALDRFCDYNR